MVRKEGNVMSVGKRIYLKREMPDMEVMNQFKSRPARKVAIQSTPVWLLKRLSS